MDIQLEKKKGFQKKHIPYVAGGAFFLILVGWIVFGDHASTLKAVSYTHLTLPTTSRV